jgi:hypothetical protein
MRHTFVRYAAAVSILLTLGCTHVVQLTVKNQLPATPAPPNLNVTAVTKDSKGQPDSTIHLGTAGPNQQVTSKFKVKNNGSYAVRGDLSSGITVFDGGDKTITDDTTDTVNITQLSRAIIDPSDTSAITATFGQLGPNVGFNPTTVQSAVGSIFGSLVYYIDVTDGAAGTQPVVKVSPAQLTGAVDFANFQWPSGHDSRDATISTDASIKVGGSVPLWGSLSVQFAANSIYKMHWSMEQFGNVQKNDTVSYQDKIVALSQAQKDDICNSLNTPHSHVMYVNSMYVIKSVVLSYQQGQAISSGASLSGGSVITASGAYDFSSSQTQEAEVDDRVVNIAGPTYEKNTLSICTAGNAHPLVTPSNALPGSLKEVHHPAVNFKQK